MRTTKGEREEKERVGVAPNMEAGGAYLQEEERQRREGQHSEEKEEISRFLRKWRSDRTSPIMKWADCVQEELGKQEEAADGIKEQQEEQLEEECQEREAEGQPREGGRAEDKSGEEHETGEESEESKERKKVEK